MFEKHGIPFCCQELEMMWENGDVDYSYAGWLVKIEPFMNILGDRPRGYVMEHCISCGKELKAKSGPKKLSRQTKIIMKELEKRGKKVNDSAFKKRKEKFEEFYGKHNFTKFKEEK